MAKFSKGILKAKNYIAPQGAVGVTPERIKHWDEQQRLMLSRNLAPSVHFDHSDDPAQNMPVQLDTKGRIKRGAHNAVGKLAQFMPSAAGDSATIELDLPDAKAAEKAKSNVVGVSPVIVPLFRDGDGNEYRDCIVAYDLVTHPVDNTQTPFVEVQGAIACSLRVFDEAGKSVVYQMGDKPFADDEDDEEDQLPKDGDGDGETGEGQPEAKNPDLPPAKATDKTKLAAVVAGFSQLGMVLPSDFDFATDGFLDVLLTSLNTLIGAQRKAEAEEAESKADEEEESNVTVQDPGYAAMSLFATRQHQERIAERLEKLLESGRCTPEEHGKHKAVIGTLKLSLDAEGKSLTPSAVEQWIESRETVPAGTFWDAEMRTKKMALTVAELPKHMRGEGFSQDEINQTANWALGGKPAATT